MFPAWFLVFWCLLQKSQLFFSPSSCEVRIILPHRKNHRVIMSYMFFHLMNLNSLPDAYPMSEVLIASRFAKCTRAHIQSQDYKKNLSYSVNPQDDHITCFANALLFFSAFPIHSLAQT